MRVCKGSWGYPVLLTAAALAAIAPSAVGRQAAGASKVRPRQVFFGDVTISGFKTAAVILGKSAKASGPETTVDSADERTSSKGRLQANEIVAHMAPNTNSRVDTVNAVGNVRFSGTRPTVDGKGVQTFRATGSQGIFRRQSQSLELDGPVTFFADEPAADGKTRQSVTGKANHVSYNGDKGLLVLSGDVEAVVITPETPPTGSPFAGDAVEVDMSQRPYTVTVHDGEVKMRLREREAKPSPKKG